MNEIAFILFVTLLVLAISQTVYVAAFRMGPGGSRLPPLPDDACPPAAVVLSLRGHDPYLADCLWGVAKQDYPEFEMHVIVDSPSDPAWESLNKLKRGVNNLQVHTLRTPRASCSLKCSALLQVVGELHPRTELVTILDADSIPQPSWLRELASASKPEKVGAVSGIRWYAPRDVCYGSWVRYVWNSAAIVQLYWYKIAWGGSLAIKRRVFHDTDLLQRWGTAFCEDTMLWNVLRQQGWRLVMVPQLFVTNRESCEYGQVYNWLCRQLLTVRLYHPRWWLIVGHALATTPSNLAALTLSAWSMITQQWSAAGWSLSGFALFQATNLALLRWIDSMPQKPNHCVPENTPESDTSTNNSRIDVQEKILRSDVQPTNDGAGLQAINTGTIIRDISESTDDSARQRGADGEVDRPYPNRDEFADATCKPPAIRFISAVLLTQITHLIAVLRTVFLRRCRWRGIDYEIHGPWRIRMVRYQPFAEKSDNHQQNSL
jgi:hypothetical protein